VTLVVSHAQPLAQCRTWLEHNLPKVPTLAVNSTTAAAEIAARDDGTAAIAGSLAAETYGLPILRENINDLAGNMTRFLVLSRSPAAPTGQDKTSIMFAIQDRVGALYDALLPFKDNGVNMTMIQSRPSKRKSWDYHFFVDFTGHADDPKNAAALAGLAAQCQFLKVLGSYPAAAPV
jgi:chorismate mutase / prephenate dehydratase